MKHPPGDGVLFHRTFRNLIREARGSPWLLFGLGAMIATAWILSIALKDPITTLTNLSKTVTKQANRTLSRILSFFSNHDTNYPNTLHHILHIKLLHYSYLLLLPLLPLLYKAIKLLFYYFTN